ncbi:MAG: hypothetical protein KJ726_08480 [Verrucomicrobia bacterium]|nr:hypothetical protein [Verrucomicrobiota bacterium]
MKTRAPWILLVAARVAVAAANGAAAPQEPTTFNAADHVHNGISRNVVSLSRWIDSFFGNYPVEEERLDDRVRVIPLVEFREGDSPSLKLRVSAKLRLPQLNRRLGLVLSAFQDENSAQFGVPGQFSDDEDVRQAALRYVLEEEKRLRVHADLGLRFYPEPDPYVRLRWRYQLTEDPVASRVIQYLFWSPRRGWGETTRFEMEEKLAPKTFVRSTTAATWSEQSRGVDWSQGYSAWYYFSRRRAMGLDWLTDGFTDPRLSVDKHRFTFKYRRRVARDWLFLQVAPFLEWPRDRDFRTTPGITLQMETIFGTGPWF